MRKVKQMLEKNSKKSWLKGLIEKYNELCKDLGVENGACRSCVPIVKFDPKKEGKSNVAEKELK